MPPDLGELGETWGTRGTPGRGCTAASILTSSTCHRYESDSRVMKTSSICQRKRVRPACTTEACVSCENRSCSYARTEFGRPGTPLQSILKVRKAPLSPGVGPGLFPAKVERFVPQTPHVNLRIGGQPERGRDVQRFRGGLVFKVHRLCVSLNSRLESNKEEER